MNLEYGLNVWVYGEGEQKKPKPLCLPTIFHNMRLFVLVQYNKTV